MTNAALFAVSLAAGALAGFALGRASTPTPLPQPEPVVVTVERSVPRLILWSSRQNCGTYEYFSPDGTRFTYGPPPEDLSEEDGWVWSLTNRNLWAVGFDPERDCPGFWGRHPGLKERSAETYREYRRTRGL